MNLSTIQAEARGCLVANTKDFAGIKTFIELDPIATPEQIDEFKKEFDAEMATTGLAVIVCSPHAVTLDQVKSRITNGPGQGAVSLDLWVPIVICENPAINRAHPDPTAMPPRKPAGRLPLELLEAAIKSLMTVFHLAEQPLGRPEFEDGFWAYTLLVKRSHVIRSL